MTRRTVGPQTSAIADSFSLVRLRSHTQMPGRYNKINRRRRVRTYDAIVQRAADGRSFSCSRNQSMEDLGGSGRIDCTRLLHKQTRNDPSTLPRDKDALCLGLDPSTYELVVQHLSVRYPLATARGTLPQ